MLSVLSEMQDNPPCKVTNWLFGCFPKSDPFEHIHTNIAYRYVILFIDRATRWIATQVNRNRGHQLPDDVRPDLTKPVASLISNRINLWSNVVYKIVSKIIDDFMNYFCWLIQCSFNDCDSSLLR